MAIVSAPRLVACLLILAVGFSHVAGIRFEVTAYSKCLGEEVQEGTLVVATYQVVPSGESSPLTKITAKVTSPFGRQLHWQSDVEEGHFGFTAKESGQFMACFWMPHGTPGKDSLMVDLEWRSGVAAKDWESIAKKEKIDGMGLELRKLDETVRAIRDEMTYFRGRWNSGQVEFCAGGILGRWISGQVECWVGERLAGETRGKWNAAEVRCWGGAIMARRDVGKDRYGEEWV
ncbi:unnamed protein product [Closterium sp. Naga37s-1]|nr:unnamed protein product [Closterium sp. Naga37s-1]